eukprot:6184676-Pleurochrysis_carterae.AAC.3
MRLLRISRITLGLSSFERHLYCRTLCRLRFLSNSLRLTTRFQLRLQRVPTCAHQLRRHALELGKPQLVGILAGLQAPLVRQVALLLSSQLALELGDERVLFVQIGLPHGSVTASRPAATRNEQALCC